MDARTIGLQRKISGVLLRAAREKVHHTVKEVAHRLGVTPGRIRSYENGTHEISLPEIEVLALFFEIPVSFFVSKEIVLETPEIEPVRPEEMRARRSMIAAKLKQARLADGKTKEDCAKAIDVVPSVIGRYESAAVDIPITHLDALAQFLHVNMYYFVERKTTSPEANHLMDMEKLVEMPKEVRGFVLNPDSLPYLRMAMKFADMPTARLKELGEILLVVK